ncbi:hypothetical protein [Pararobbsia alpina]|uniref:Uncharacterized protein n=1 Tax=Pararobbsia alpina TaxID=621374 RepID=A0A6S7B4G3_9BURK|nr:hypothetical protein [Pararobbsia alpina]CAB3779108.1 hypothetical protein LMG28138_00793 [Pararobbsia alpina]
MAMDDQAENVAENANAWTAEELEQIEQGIMDEEVFAARIFAQLEAAPALLTREQVELIEDEIRRDSWQRAALIFCTSTGKDLCRKIERDRDFAILAAQVKNSLTAVKERYEQLTELLSTVDVRIMLALCGRKDMEAVLAEAE